MAIILASKSTEIRLKLTFKRFKILLEGFIRILRQLALMAPFGVQNAVVIVMILYRYCESDSCNDVSAFRVGSCSQFCWKYWVYPKGGNTNYANEERCYNLRDAKEKIYLQGKVRTLYYSHY